MFHNSKIKAQNVNFKIHNQGRRKVMDIGSKVQLVVWGRCQLSSGSRAGSW